MSTFRFTVGGVVRKNEKDLFAGIFKKAPEDIFGEKGSRLTGRPLVVSSESWGLDDVRRMVVQLISYGWPFVREELGEDLTYREFLANRPDRDEKPYYLCMMYDDESGWVVVYQGGFYRYGSEEEARRAFDSLKKDHMDVPPLRMYCKCCGASIVEHVSGKQLFAAEVDRDSEIVYGYELHNSPLTPSCSPCVIPVTVYTRYNGAFTRFIFPQERETYGFSVCTQDEDSWIAGENIGPLLSALGCYKDIDMEQSSGTTGTPEWKHYGQYAHWIGEDSSFVRLDTAHAVTLGSFTRTNRGLEVDCVVGDFCFTMPDAESAMEAIERLCGVHQ